ncbi:MAG: NAD-dependent epimerase/dehydratase family protein [Myxococcota bacterium]|nr:NAD-dependent epimerase/dehydratase family protein [Myxococcota bacterium]
MVGHILITGGAGFIGSWLARSMLARGLDVRILDDLSTGSVENIPQSRKLSFIQGSVRDPQSVRKAAEGAELVIHLAGLTGMRLAHALKKESFQIAADGTACLLAESPASARLVLFSSSAVYGLTAGEAISETLEITDASVCSYDGGEVGYAAGKWKLEQLALQAAESGRQVLTLRPFNVVGPGQSPRYGMVLPSFVRRARAGDPLLVYDLGEQTRSFCDVRNFCETTMDLIDRPKAWALSGSPINIGNPEQTSIRGLAEMVIHEAGSQSKIINKPYAQVFPGRTDVQHRIPNVARLHSLVGRPTWMGIREIVRETLNCEGHPETKWSQHPIS